MEAGTTVRRLYRPQHRSRLRLGAPRGRFNASTVVRLLGEAEAAKVVEQPPRTRDLLRGRPTLWLNGDRIAKGNGAVPGARVARIGTPSQHTRQLRPCRCDCGTMSWLRKHPGDPMKHSILRLIALTAALALLLAACGTTGATPSPAPTATATATVPLVLPTVAPTLTPSSTPAPSEAPTALGVTGLWSGTWQDTSPDTLSGTFAVTLAQTGSQLSGTIIVSGTRCLTSGTVTGTTTGSTINFGAVSGQITITYKGSISGNRMQGTYSAPDCGNATGNWVAAHS